MAGHNIDIQTPEGNINTTLPDYALDTTSEAMLKQLEAIAKDNKSLNDAFTKLINSTNQHAKTGQAQQADIIQTLKNANDARQQGSAPGGVDSYEARFEGFMAGFGKVIDTLSIATLGLAGLVSGVTLGLYRSVSEMSDNIYNLQEVGVGFGNANSSIINTVASMNALGISTEQAVQLMTDFSRSTVLLGRDRIPKLTKRFLDMTNQGIDLGLSLEQASQSAMEEVENRSKVMSLSGISDKKLADSASRQIQLQSAYSSALGISIDQLRDSSSAMLEGNHNVAATLALFPDSYEALDAFVTASMATMGKGGEAIISAMLDSGTAIGAFSTEGARALAGLTSLAPGIAEMQQELQNSMGEGFTSVADGVAFSKRFNEAITSFDVRNMQAVAMGRGPSAELAKNMLLVRANVIQANKKQKEIDELMKKGGLNPDSTRKSILMFENAFNTLTGMFSNFKNVMMVEFSPLLAAIADAFANKDVLVALKNGFGMITEAAKRLVKTLFGVDFDAATAGDAMSGTLVNGITATATTLAKWVDNIAGWLAKFKGEDFNPAKMVAVFIKDVIVETGLLIVSTIWNALTSTAGWVVVGGLVAAVMAKTLITSLGTMLAGKVLGGIGGTAGGMGGTAGGMGAGAGALGKAKGLASLAGAANILAMGAAVLMLAKGLQMIDGLSNGGESLAILAAGITGLSVAVGLMGLPPIAAAITVGSAALLSIGAAGLVVASGLSIAAPAIMGIIDAINRYKTASTSASTESVERLSAIPSDNIIRTSAAIRSLSEAMSLFDDSSSFAGIITNAFSGLEVNAFSKIDHAGISRSANAISRLALALGNFAGLDGKGLRSVSAAVDVMTQANARATTAYDQFSRLDASAINKASLAVFNMNAGNKGMLVAPQPTQGGNYLSNMARAVSSDGTAEAKKTANKTKGSTGQPVLPKGANAVEDLLIKIVHNTSLSARNLQAINKKTET